LSESDAGYSGYQSHLTRAAAVCSRAPSRRAFSGPSARRGHPAGSSVAVPVCGSQRSHKEKQGRDRTSRENAPASSEPPAFGRARRPPPACGLSA
uniref:Uncharacterized protein n=1 Tax=Mustela putorius furo TaxID=9669 RepID=M3Y6T1_MUSPF